MATDNMSDTPWVAQFVTIGVNKYRLLKPSESEEVLVNGEKPKVIIEVYGNTPLFKYMCGTNLPLKEYTTPPVSNEVNEAVPVAPIQQNVRSPNRVPKKFENFEVENLPGVGEETNVQIEPAPIQPNVRRPIRVPKKFENFEMENLPGVGEETNVQIEPSPIQQNLRRSNRILKKNFKVENLPGVGEETNVHIEPVVTVVTRKKSEDKVKKLPTRKNKMIKNKSGPGTRKKTVKRDQINEKVQNKENIKPEVSFEDLIPVINNNMVLLKKFIRDIASRNRSMRRRKTPVAEETLKSREAFINEVRGIVNTQSTMTDIFCQMEPFDSSQN